MFTMTIPEVKIESKQFLNTILFENFENHQEATSPTVFFRPSNNTIFINVNGFSNRGKPFLRLFKYFYDINFS